MTCLTPSSFLSCDTVLPRSLDEAGTAPPRASRYLADLAWMRVRGGRGGWIQQQERERERERERVKIGRQRNRGEIEAEHTPRGDKDEGDIRL